MRESRLGPTVMILTCSQCATRYHVDPESLGSEGRVVRCAGCGHRWTAKPPADAPKVLEIKAPSPTAAGRSAGKAAAARRSSFRIVALLAGAFVILVVASAAIGRNEIVAYFPASAPIYRALWLPVAEEPGLGLEFENVTPERLVEGGVSVLVVEGEIVNQSKQTRSVPPIRVTLLDGGGRQLQHEILNSKDLSLDAGGKTTFSGRLVNPPSQARNFSITFDIDS
jgi:predicted Zn finger-like uncharacterized protein